MTNRTYLIGAFSSGEMAQPYFDSLKVLGDSVTPIIIQYQHKGEFQKVNVPLNVKLIKLAKDYSGNTGKHKDFREYIAPILTGEDWTIFTDMHDVVFQAPLPEFPDVNILVASEGKMFGQINFWKDLFPVSMWADQAYNVGCFAMRTSLVKDFWELLFIDWMKFVDWYKTGTIPQIKGGFPFNAAAFPQRLKDELAIIFNGFYDTMFFNEFIKEYQSKEELEGLFGVYAYNFEVGNIVKKNGVLYTKEDKKISIAHYNGLSSDGRKEQGGGE